MVRARGLVLVATVLGALSLFGVVAAHVVLTQNQFRLDDLRDQAAARQVEYDRLRLEVAELEAPSRIVADAQQRLGMVVPPTIVYLAPSGGTDTVPPEDRVVDPAPAAGAPAGKKVTQPAAVPNPDSPGEATGWSTVKPHLADG